MRTQPAGWLEPELTENAKRILEARYLEKDEDGNLIETPGGMFYRVAREIASAERNETERYVMEREFYNMMAELKFLPNSPTLMNAGKDNGLQYSACFVIPIGDSMEEIFETVKRTAIIHKSGGGTGFDFSHLREKGAIVNSTGGVASGPVSFMEVINAATEAVKQGGTRRGANMGILRVDHPDIIEFIYCKNELRGNSINAIRTVGIDDPVRDELRKALLEGQISNFNISVGITDDFMKAVQEGDWYDIKDPRTGEVVRKEWAPAVWQQLIVNAWTTGDPGLVFLDTINRSESNPVPSIGPIEATNPCGEIPLYSNEACQLGSINLSKFILDGGVNVVELDRITRLAVRFIDDLIDVNPYPDEIIAERVKSLRRIGIGVMGWADMLIQLEDRYDSYQGVRLARWVMGFINRQANDESERLAIYRGPFPLWSESIYKDGLARRNSTCTAIAPTGTISMIAGCSSGIEPLFALSFDHAGSLDGKLEVEYNELYRQAVREYDGRLPAHIRDTFRTAHEIDPEWHVKMQAAFQEHVQNAVSKSVNLRNDATVDDVERVYRLAYEMGCKGITVYRDGSKVGVLHVNHEETCPECEAVVILEEGCRKCYSCGWSACGV